MKAPDICPACGKRKDPAREFCVQCEALHLKLTPLSPEQLAEVATAVRKDLAGSWKFRLQVALATAGIFLLGFTALDMIWGFSIKQGIESHKRTLDHIASNTAVAVAVDASNSLAAIRQDMRAQIASNFQAAEVRALMQEVVSNRSAEMFNVFIDPEVKRFQGEVRDSLARADEKINKTIRQFDVHYEITLLGNWSNRGFGRPMLGFSEERPCMLVSSRANPTLKPIAFYLTSYQGEHPQNAPTNIAVVEVFGSVRSGDFPRGQSIDEILTGYDKMEFMVPFVNKAKTDAATVRIMRTRVDFLVNGEKRGNANVPAWDFKVPDANQFRFAEVEGKNIFGATK